MKQLLLIQAPLPQRLHHLLLPLKLPLPPPAKSENKPRHIVLQIDQDKNEKMKHKNYLNIDTTAAPRPSTPDLSNPLRYITNVKSNDRKTMKVWSLECKKDKMESNDVLRVIWENLKFKRAKVIN